MIATATRRLILLSLLIVTFAICAIAQDAGQVLRVFVGFNTMKNTNSGKMSEQVRVQVDRLSSLAQTANSAGKHGEALKHLYHGMRFRYDGLMHY